MDLAQQTKGVNVRFKELVCKILERIKNELTFDGQGRWVGTQLEGIRACIILTIQRKVILSSNAVC